MSYDSLIIANGFNETNKKRGWKLLQAPSSFRRYYNYLIIFITFVTERPSTVKVT
jgi:hypothetical protein